MADLGSVLGPLSRIICLGVMCAWAPILIILFAQTKLRAWLHHESTETTST